MTWHLLLDYDDEEQVPGARDQRVPDSAAAHGIIKKRLARAGYRVGAWSFERSTNGWHAKVELDPAPSSPMEIVALQAVCGSDPSRESCNVQRAREVQALGAYAAQVLAAELDKEGDNIAARLRAVAAELDVDPDVVLGAVKAFLWVRGIESDSFWIDRWNTLYAPNPNRRKEG